MKVLKCYCIYRLSTSRTLFTDTREDRGNGDEHKLSDSLGKLRLFLQHKNTSKWPKEKKKKSILFPSRQSKSRNEPTVCTLCTNVHLQIPLSVEGIWRLLNGNCVSRMCDCECNKGVLSFCCACGLWVSYPLRSSLSSAATLRSSASISSSSCRLKNSCTSLESVHL